MTRATVFRHLPLEAFNLAAEYEMLARDDSLYSCVNLNLDRFVLCLKIEEGNSHPVELHDSWSAARCTALHTLLSGTLSTN